MFENKKIIVALKDDAKTQYFFLQNLVEEELDKGKVNTDTQKLLCSINRTLALLKTNPHAGIHISKRKIPREYTQKYRVKNLWKCNLIQHWRLIYVIESDEIKVVNIVLDVLDHKKYSKKFGYKKN